MRKLGLFLTISVGVAVVSHAAFVYTAPDLAVAASFRKLEKQGLKPNKINFGKPYKAGEEYVGYGNPDSFSTRAIIDLSDGPLRFSAKIPEDQAYWSFALFQSDNDVAVLYSDRDLSSPQLDLVIATKAQMPSLDVDIPIATLPDERGYFIVRSFPTDRFNPKIVEGTLKAASETTLTILDQ
ncbi:MAG: hypothetical protein AAF720_05770 [Pseudomonadota bacterium]